MLLLTVLLQPWIILLSLKKIKYQQMKTLSCRKRKQNNGGFTEMKTLHNGMSIYPFYWDWYHSCLKLNSQVKLKMTKFQRGESNSPVIILLQSTTWGGIMLLLRFCLEHIYLAVGSDTLTKLYNCQVLCKYCLFIKIRNLLFSTEDININLTSYLCWE